MRFFVTGLPRSRTAWLANFLTYGPLTCLHDEFRHLDNPRDLEQLFTAAGGPCVGHADPANVLFQDALISAFPAAMWVVIERDPTQAQRSAERAFGQPLPDFSIYARKLRELRTKRKVLQIPFQELNSDFANRIGNLLHKDFCSGSARNALLDRLNIQIDPQILLADIADLQAGPLAIAPHVEL